MKQYTQAELAAMYEKQQSREGQLAMATRKAFLKNGYERLGIFVSFQEVGKMVNRQTGENRFYMKG